MQTRPFIRAREGASALEFALIAPIFFFLMMGIIEFGLFMFHKVVIESITMQVGREASLNTSSGNSPTCAGTPDRFSYIRCYVREKSAYLINGEETQVNINTLAAGATRIPDICLGNGSVAPNSGPTCNGNFEEVNGISGYQGASTSNNPGAAGELIEVRVSYPWHVLVPYMSRIIGSTQQDGSRSGVVMITSSTVFRNEPE